MTYNSLQGIFTTMIGFVTWPPYKSVQKGGQVTKLIIVVKIPCKLLYVIQVKEFKMFNFLALLDIRDFGRL